MSVAARHIRLVVAVVRGIVAVLVPVAGLAVGSIMGVAVFVVIGFGQERQLPMYRPDSRVVGCRDDARIRHPAVKHGDKRDQDPRHQQRDVATSDGTGLEQNGHEGGRNHAGVLGGLTKRRELYPSSMHGGNFTSAPTNWSLELVDQDGKRIDKIPASLLPEPAPEESVERQPESPVAN